ncbi:MAG: TVP38/TMEM64 family protein [Phycisphaerales bacterium]|nr:TVP38/TMEM64 family protein [Phycisphaerales bacterium]MCB9856609.1 TVP38/TMEM64 family protein [Phycisphaerales bacterium]
MRLFVVIIALTVLFTAPLLFFGDTFDVALSGDEAVARLRGYGDWAWIVGIGLIVADLVLPIPATAVMAALGIIYGPVIGGVLSGVASFLAGAIAYLATRMIGHRAAVFIVGERDLARTEKFFDRAGGYAVAFSRPLPILPEVTACLAGLAAMRRRVFFVALGIGSFVTGFAYAWVGHAGASNPGMAMLIGAVIPVAIWPIARRMLKQRDMGGVESAD